MEPLFEEGPRREALRHMFRNDPDGAHDVLDQYLESHPHDPVAHSLNGAVTFYHHLSTRMPDGPRETLALVILGKGITFPSDLKKELETDLGRARAYAKGNCPADLLSLAIVESVKRDYLATVSQKWMASFECARRAHTHARRLLKLAPHAHDAYFVLAITEYMMYRIPAILRPFSSIEGVRGDRRKAMRYCETVIETGHYFKEFARRLTVDLYLDDNDRPSAIRELTLLSTEFPTNAGFVKNLKKLTGPSW
jgi:hypothetical protein